MRNAILFVLTCIILPINLLAQNGIEEVLTFTDEVTRMAVDPAGVIYIVSPAGGKIIIYNPETGEKHIHGGLGSSSSLFDTPTDIDPTNGLVIYVADAGGQKILRFSHEMRLQEQFLAVEPTESTASPGQSSHFGRENIFQDTEQSFTPEYLSITETGQIFSIDVNQNQVVSWRKTGQFSANPLGQLTQIVTPVDIQVGNNQLYIADQSKKGILVFDHLGNYRRTFAGGSFTNIQALGWHQNQLWVIQTDRVSIFEPENGLNKEIMAPNIIGNNSLLLDALPVDKYIYWLTSKGLFRQNFLTD